MLSRTRVLPVAVATLSLALAGTAGAVAPKPPHRSGKSHVAIEATSAAKAKAPLRQRARFELAAPTAATPAWDTFQRAHGAAWVASWDRATGVPSRIWGGKIEVPGSSADADVAAAAARRYLADHVGLLAPGASADDFELVSNHDDGHGLRSIGFVQRHQGLRVVGGQLSFRFKNDRLFAISSQALPSVAIAGSPRVRAAAGVATRAREATVTDLGLRTARASAPRGAVIVPLVADDGVLGYRVAVPVDVDAGADGAWTVYADPRSGEPLVRVARAHFATGTVVYDAPVRWPGTGRQDYPAVRAGVVVDGASVFTAADGLVTWTPDASVSLMTTVIGQQVALYNLAGDTDDPPEVTRTLTIAPDSVARWSEAGDEALDAQVSAYVHAQIAKDFARTLVTDPQVLAFIDDVLPTFVNINDECNAFYTRQPVVEDGPRVGTINFFASSTTCENTSLLADVVYHEFGHGLHDHSVIEGVGLFDSAMSEGASDFLAAIITEDPGMGRGFFHDDEPLRHLDQAEGEATWPDDVGEVHQTGIIYGGAFWDLRKAAIAALGDEAGRALTNRLFVATLQRATDIPSSLIEALVADDDDGDLGNGTPNECLIREAFGRHGLRTVGAEVDAAGAVTGTDGETTMPIAVVIGGLSAACPGDEIARVTVAWEPRFDAQSPAPGIGELTAGMFDSWSGTVALPDAGEVGNYHVTVHFTDDTTLRVPDNRGDDEYEVYRGEVVELYCHDFETDPFTGAAAWSHGTEAGTDLWQWGAPAGLGGDPAYAFSGDRVIGQAITGESGTYEPNSVSWARMPEVDVGNYSDVRLHYRRWLGVEDGYYDKATIYANGAVVWQNFDSGQAFDASTHTRDREWVFKDVPLSTRIFDGSVEVMFELTTDQGLEFGGWAMDDVCIVANPDAVCGDGTINGAEQCDNGGANGAAPDACRANCRRASCGDGVVDSGEECDDGNNADGDACPATCETFDDGGCCSASDDPTRALVPAALIGLGLLVGGRRRRRARP